MVVRAWRGQATPDHAPAYAKHAVERVFPELSRIDGHRGAYLLRRSDGETVEFLVLTLWESMDAVRRFAGPSPERAVVEPEAQAVLSRFDDFVRHYEVVHDTVRGS